MMLVPFILCALWVIAANVTASRRGRSRRATPGLILVGVPLLGLVTWQYGPVAGFAALGLGSAVLRWPLLPGPLRRRQARGVRPPGAQPVE